MCLTRQRPYGPDAVDADACADVYAPYEETSLAPGQLPTGPPDQQLTRGQTAIALLDRPMPASSAATIPSRITSSSTAANPASPVKALSGAPIRTRRPLCLDFRFVRRTLLTQRVPFNEVRITLRSEDRRHPRCVT